MKLSAKQKAALDALGSDRRRLFCIEVVRNGGNATQAAIAVGYSADTAYSIASELLSFPKVAAAVEALKDRALNVKLGSLESRRAYMRKKALHAVEEKDQLKALEMLGKTHGDFIDRKEVSGPSGAPIQVQVVLTEAESDELAGEGES